MTQQPRTIRAAIVAPDTLSALEQLEGAFHAILSNASPADQDAIIDVGLEDAIAAAFVAVRNVTEREPETRAEREADYRADLAMGK